MLPKNASQTTCHLTMVRRLRGDNSYHLNLAVNDHEAPFAHEVDVRRGIEGNEPLVHLRDLRCSRPAVCRP
jgi:hypothetical protein